MRQISRLSLRDLLYVLCRDRWKIAATALAAVSLAAGWLFLIADTIYVAESRVLVRLGREKLTGIETLNRDNTNFLFQERGQDINNMVEVLRDPQFIYPVLEQLAAGVGPEPAPPPSGFRRFKHEIKQIVHTVAEAVTAPLYWLGLRSRLPPQEAMAQVLRGAMQATSMEDTDVIRITFGWTDPEFAAKAANTVVAALLNRHIAIYGSEAPGRFYTTQLDEQRARLRAADDKLEAFRARERITSLPLQKEMLLREVTEAEGRRNEVDLRLADHRTLEGWLASEMQSAAAGDAASGWPTTPEVRGRPILDLGTLDRQYFDLLARRTQLAATHVPGSPEMQQLGQRMAALRRQKLEVIASHIRTAQQIDGREQAALSALLEDKRGRLARLNAASAEHAELERGRAAAEQALQNFSRKTEELRVAELLNTQRISGMRVMSEALPPATPAAPRKGLVLGLALVIGLLLGLAYSALLEYFDHSFRGAEDVQGVLGVPLLMTVPRVRGGGGA